jgi:hypothetical protein
MEGKDLFKPFFGLFRGLQNEFSMVVYSCNLSEKICIELIRVMH